jgi:hypothetical protein
VDDDPLARAARIDPGLGLVVPDRICATALGYRYLDTLVARFV